MPTFPSLSGRAGAAAALKAAGMDAFVWVHCLPAGLEEILVLGDAVS